MGEQVWYGGRLRELRAQSEMTRKELAEAAGVSERAITQWERNEREPSWTNVLALAEALGVTCEAFTVEPAEVPQPKRGRPKKDKPTEQERK